jgi:hypothetical protein
MFLGYSWVNLDILCHWLPKKIGLTMCFVFLGRQIAWMENKNVSF